MSCHVMPCIVMYFHLIFQSAIGCHDWCLVSNARGLCTMCTFCTIFESDVNSCANVWKTKRKTKKIKKKKLFSYANRTHICKTAIIASHPCIRTIHQKSDRQIMYQTANSYIRLVPNYNHIFIANARTYIVLSTLYIKCRCGRWKETKTTKNVHVTCKTRSYVQSTFEIWTQHRSPKNMSNE